MTVNVPTPDGIDQIVIITTDCLRWDYHEGYKDIYPNGVWYEGTTNGTFTPMAHASMFTGTNPPRHGVLEFGMTSDKQSIMETTDSVSFSAFINGTYRAGIGCVPNESKMPHYSFPELAGKPGLQPGPYFEGDIYHQIHQHDVTFLHDWTVHGSGPAHEQQWPNTFLQAESDEDWPKYYQETVDVSMEAHRKFIEDMKNNTDLYDNTLFVFWGDHGQAMHEEPFDATLHGHFPEINVSRIPIAFASEQFETDEYDRTTNARPVDIVPTLYSIMDAAGMEYTELDHELEGVDLTEYDGSLYSYASSGVTVDTGDADGVVGIDDGMIVSGMKRDIEIESTTSSMSQEVVDNDNELVDLYRKVRSEPDTLER